MSLSPSKRGPQAADATINDDIPPPALSLQRLDYGDSAPIPATIAEDDSDADARDESPPPPPPPPRSVPPSKQEEGDSSSAEIVSDDSDDVPPPPPPPKTALPASILSSPALLAASGNDRSPVPPVQESSASSTAVAGLYRRASLKSKSQPLFRRAVSVDTSRFAGMDMDEKRYVDARVCARVVFECVCVCVCVCMCVYVHECTLLICQVRIMFAHLLFVQTCISISFVLSRPRIQLCDSLSRFCSHHPSLSLRVSYACDFSREVIDCVAMLKAGILMNRHLTDMDRLGIPPRTYRLDANELTLRWLPLPGEPPQQQFGTLCEISCRDSSSLFPELL
jgi:hypothetical protein